MLSEGLKLDQLDGAQIAELQNMLVKAGYDPGAVDGVMGPKTKAAYARFLSRQGLSGYQGANNEIVVRLVTQLQDPNAGPELWGGLVHGGETMVPTASNPTGQKPTEAPAPPPAQTTAAPAPTGGGAVSGTPITPIPELSASEQEAAVMSRFPHLAFLLQHPEVRDVLIRATQGGWDQGQLQGEIYKTWWWKLTDASMRVWDAKIFQDPATTQKEWDQKALQVHNKALQLGAPVTHSDAHWLAGRVLREGWSDEQLNSFLGQTIRNAGGASPGLVTDKMAGIKALAGKYLSSMDDAKAQEYAIRITEGSINQEAIETMLRDQAKNRFGWLSERIDQGLSPLDLFDSTRRVVAETLEMDPATINLNDPKWSELTSPVMEGTKQRSMNFAEAQRWARKRAEWRFTDNANKESSQMSLNLLKTMGGAGLMANPILEYGSQGGEVAWLSQILGWWGYSPSMTDTYDWQTAEAVAQFQRNYGYEATGKMGPDTWALMEALMQGMPAPNAVSTGPGTAPQSPYSATPVNTATKQPGAPGGGVAPLPTTRDAKARLSTLLNQYGLGGMIGWVTEKLEDGASVAEIELEMYDQPAFKARFPVIDARRTAGLNPVTAAEVLEYETRGRELLRRAGITGQFGDRSYLQNLMGVDVSLSELQSRIQDGLLKVTQAPPEVRAAFTSYFGAEGDVALAQLFLDPTIAAPELEKRAMTAVAGGIGARFGLTIAQGIAREIADVGVSEQGIWQGYRRLDEMRSFFDESISETEDLTMEGEGISAVFGTRPGASDALENRRASRVAQFKGGGGAYATADKGVAGFGVADS